MAELRQYPTDQELKDALDAHSKGKPALMEFIRAQRAKRAVEKRDLSEGNCTTQDMKNSEDQWSGSPYIVYRNPKDDRIRMAFEEASKRLTAEGKPLFHPKGS